MSGYGHKTAGAEADASGAAYYAGADASRAFVEAFRHDGGAPHRHETLGKEIRYALSKREAAAGTIAELLEYVRDKRNSTLKFRAFSFAMVHDCFDAGLVDVAYRNDNSKKAKRMGKEGAYVHDLGMVRDAAGKLRGASWARTDFPKAIAYVPFALTEKGKAEAVSDLARRLVLDTQGIGEVFLKIIELHQRLSMYEIKLKYDEAIGSETKWPRTKRVLGYLHSQKFVVLDEKYGAACEKWLRTESVKGMRDEIEPRLYQMARFSITNEGKRHLDNMEALLLGDSLAL